MSELNAPPTKEIEWRVWNRNNVTQACTVLAKLWIEACRKGRSKLGCSQVDAIPLESTTDLNVFPSKQKKVTIIRVLNQFKKLIAPENIEEMTSQQQRDYLLVALVTDMIRRNRKPLSHR